MKQNNLFSNRWGQSIFEWKQRERKAHSQGIWLGVALVQSLRSLSLANISSIEEEDQEEEDDEKKKDEDGMHLITSAIYFGL